jgi:hypothetical protein
MATISTTTSALLPAVNVAATGKAYFLTDNNKFVVNSGSAWIEVHSDGTGAVYENRWGASFDGSNKLNADLGVTVGSQSAYTISFWANPNAGVGNGNGPVRLNTKSNRSTNPADTNLLRFNGTNSDGTLKNVEVYHKAGSNSYAGITIVTADHGIAAGNWFHYTQSWDGSTVKAYINGALKGSSSQSAWLPMDTAATIQVEAGHGFNSHWNGFVDDISYHTSALDQTAVTALYNGGTPAKITGAAGWWRMGDDSNDSATSGGNIATITDSSGNGNDATQSTASSQPTFKALAQSTTSVSFDGSDDSFAFAGSSDIQLDQSYTACSWFKVNSIGSASTPRGLITWGAASLGQGRGLYIMGSSAGAFSYGGDYNLDSTTSISTGVWYHVAATYDGATLKVYVNGTLDSTKTVSLSSFTYSMTHIGELYYSQSNADRHFDGDIDELALFNSALSASDIASLAATRGAHVENDLSLSPVAYYRMGEDDYLTDGASASQITDASGNGNHATQSTAVNQPTASVSPVIYV